MDEMSKTLRNVVPHLAALEYLIVYLFANVFKNDSHEKGQEIIKAIKKDFSSPNRRYIFQRIDPDSLKQIESLLALAEQVSTN